MFWFEAILSSRDLKVDAMFTYKMLDLNNISTFLASRWIQIEIL
jgi:hypothetical protein